MISTKEESDINTKTGLQTRPYHHFYSRKNVFIALLATTVYLLLSYLLIGFKTDQVMLAGIFNGMYFAAPATRRFIKAFSIFIIYWILFDWMKAFPNYRFNDVSIRELYELEKQIFGITVNGSRLTLNEYFGLHHNSFADILAGLFYLCWIPVPLGYAAYLFFKERRRYFEFSLSFFIVNIIGFVGYYLYPAAPPWYVANYGFDFVAATPGNTAGLARFDELTGTGIFAGLYSKSSNVFAAMPSLHAAYMLIATYYSAQNKSNTFRTVLFAIITAGIWFTAVYSYHHYLLDVLAGIACAVLGIWLFQLFIKRTKAGAKLMHFLLQKTS
jgi:membrane-associated phospholipid phosphatase